MTAYPKHHFRVQGYVEPETFAILFDDRYPTWGAQTRIVKALLGALAKHVAMYCDPHLPTHERDAELDDILAGVTFGRPLRSRGSGHGHPPATGASVSHSGKASGSPQERSEPRPALGQRPGAPDAPEGHQSAKEGQATATAAR